ncbi:uncharacterized protein BT62DRAFT_924699 [Guyanagaster necrorhizus]|uniref:Uncharacterized protein n=1 Tax=Guyanagaster necrorhizus TaxID=856835 RepID=A0A9P7VF80_9AGAR|nr:uncharacterized protein BT62DRAFT_924699 [Guyanagaster necrorhizus MCA 3950]KAG7439463.1 hypothetical protein BT62DRAFT_924699 [Guyanagaster necrorhizus MCA 3950]
MSSLNFNVSRAAEWPTEIQQLACLLDSPIPSRLANGPYPPVSSRASPLLEELEIILECSPEHLTDSSSEVLDILDLLLSTVGALKALAGGSKDDTRQSTIPFWSLLIRSLSFVCYDKSYIMQDVAFVRPRSSHSLNKMGDGHASLLISHIVEDIQRPRPIVDDEASGHVSMMRAERSNEPSQEEYDSETSYDDESSSDSDTSYERTEASTDPTSAQSSYVPLDGHVLAYWRHPNSVVLPYLCVTDEEDIFSLMSGVVYQRSTWGIAGPVIGIILSKTGLVGRVVFGWLDNVCVDPDLPAVHFAHADGTRIDPSLGVYDLTDAVSGLKFAQFIIGLRAHVEGIVAQSRTPTFKRLPWRSDTIDDDDSGSEEEQWEQRIVCWLNTVEKCDTDHTAPSDPSSTHCCSYNMADSKKRNTRASSKATSARHPRRSLSADSKREFPPADLTPFVPDIDLTYPREPSLGATGSKTPSDRASAQAEERGRQQTKTDGGSSNNGKTGAKSLAGISPAAKLSFSSYAHDRKIISLSNIPLRINAHGSVEAADEINEMLEFYEEMTKRVKSATTQSELLAIAEEQEGHIQVPDEEVGRRTDDKQGSNGTRATRKENLLQPFSVTCSVTKLAPKMTFPTGVVMNTKELHTKLLFAVFVAEYKKPTQTYAKAVVQAKMYAEASVRYLASLGVTKQAVFALATDGVEGAVLMAWCSSDSETIYIVERNVQTFNISSPIEVYHFVTVLLRLREYGDTKLKDAVLKPLEVDEFQQKSWSKTAQFNRME